MDFFGSSTPPVESPGVYLPQDFYIKKLQFTTSSGSIDFEKLLIQFSYYEDIFSFVTSGHLTVVDAQGFIEILQLDGNEFLEIEYVELFWNFSSDLQYV